MTRFSSPGYKALRTEYNTSFDGHDPWGSNIGWRFAIAEFLHHKGDDTPEGWEFRDSPLHDGWQPEGYPDSMLADMWAEGEFTTRDAEIFGDVLNRYDNLLRAAGLDY